MSFAVAHAAGASEGGTPSCFSIVVPGFVLLVHVCIVATLCSLAENLSPFLDKASKIGLWSLLNIIVLAQKPTTAGLPLAFLPRSSLRTNASSMRRVAGVMPLPLMLGR